MLCAPCANTTAECENGSTTSTPMVIANAEKRRRHTFIIAVIGRVLPQQSPASVSLEQLLNLPPWSRIRQQASRCVLPPWSRIRQQASRCVSPDTCARAVTGFLIVVTQ